jgi:hypothetical protein
MIGLCWPSAKNCVIFQMELTTARYQGFCGTRLAVLRSLTVGALCGHACEKHTCCPRSLLPGRASKYANKIVKSRAKTAAKIKVQERHDIDELLHALVVYLGNYTVLYPYSDTCRTCSSITKIYGGIKHLFSLSLAPGMPLFYTGKFGQSTKVTL